MEYSPSLGIQVLEAGMKYVDRGDPAVSDFAIGDLTLDSGWHSLDLSGIIPVAGASHMVHIVVEVVAPEALDHIHFRKNGNSNVRNISTTSPQIPNGITRTTDMWVMCDAGRKVAYMGNSDMGFASVSIVIRGWIEG